jgi:hypothetical protein
MNTASRFEWNLGAAAPELIWHTLAARLFPGGLLFSWTPLVGRRELLQNNDRDGTAFSAVGTQPSGLRGHRDERTALRIAGPGFVRPSKRESCY